ncbi:double-strand break repair protein AddB [Altererythrobacter indicus]|uniref:Double-strand break repair protein AddB n=1 Tax=Altericroceibacterium indicum TaxID=374177 RepID=A0A845AAA0_9SPHN|nr:double-strand break repair protein AddB [Altericroceibacterium indicum]MXP25466.1 double-strand break repair protein AddB [Altericroceibacterium indicum]
MQDDVTERGGPQIFSIAAHRGFADALVAGLVPRYGDDHVGLARLTLILPSTRAIRTVSEAFIRHSGEGLLMPRMVAVGDLDLDETLGPLLDPLGAGDDIPPAADPTRRWLRIAEMIREERGAEAPKGGALLRLARELAQAMDRLLVEDIAPDELLGPRVLDLLGDLSHHWQDSLHLFARVQTRWLAELQTRDEVDAATRRNALFKRAAMKWKEQPPAHPVVAAGVTSAAPTLAGLLRVISELPRGAVVLPDCDLSLDADVWEELGRAGAPAEADGAPFAASDASTHPQYHLKLLLNRMGVARGEVQQWHRAGMSKGPPERSYAISNLFLPPQASKEWVALPAEKRRLSGVRLMETANPEEEAQAIALLIRQKLEEPEQRAALVTPDRALAERVVGHLRRWNIAADDSAGRALSHTAAGRLILLLAETLGDNLAPVSFMGLLQHPLAGLGNAGISEAGQGRPFWLENTRLLERALRGPRPEPGLAPLAEKVAALAKRKPTIAVWWQNVDALFAPLLDLKLVESPPLADMLDALAEAGEQLCGEALWAREDGRALSGFVEELRLHARDVGTQVAWRDLPVVLRDAMEMVAVRPPYGGHPRVAIYGLLESRMTRADLVICAGLNEGTWPRSPSIDTLIAPPVLRALGVPGGDFRIGLAAHDLAGALGAPEVVLSRAQRDAGGPAIPSRFLLRVEALLGSSLIDDHRELDIPRLARTLDTPASEAPPYPRPKPRPTARQRDVEIRVTALDRLRSDPYQFYADAILGLKKLDGLDEEPSAAWKGIAAHKILENWHDTYGDMPLIAEQVLDQMNAHPLMRGLWRPRLMAALEWVEATVAEQRAQGREPVKWEAAGRFEVDGVTIKGRADRIDRMADGTLAIVDYKTGKPPSSKMVEQGFALQLGLIGLMAEAGGFRGLEGEAARFEYWSLAKDGDGFGYIKTPVREGQKKTGLFPEDFLPETRRFLREAIAQWINGDEAFTARLNPDLKGYTDYDQLMRLDEWFSRVQAGQGRGFEENAA